MTVRLLTPLVFLALGLLAGEARAGSAEPPQDSVGRWRFQASYLLRGFFGTTRVREFSSSPAKLSLHGDLSLEAESGGHVAAIWDGRRVRALVESDYLLLSGGGNLRHDFAFDEGNFVANRPFDVSGAIFFLRGTVALKKLVDLGDSAWVGPVFGLEYANFTIEIDQPGVDQSGEHWSQFAPYPVLGVAGEWQISPRLDLRGQITGTYVSDWPTHRKEGGRLFMTAKTMMSEVVLSWRATRHWFLTAGAQYQYWDGDLRSDEDGNELTFSSPGLIVGAEVRF